MKTKSYLFDDALAFEFDASKVEVDAGARLIGQNQTSTFSQDFSTSDGFVFDPDLVEFVAGVVRQKDKRPTNSVFGATFTSSATSNWTGVVPTLSGGAAVAGGLLACTGATNIYAEYTSTAIGNLAGVGTVKVKYKPNYSGTPAANTNIVSFKAPSGFADTLVFFHSVTGTLRFTAYNSAGSAIHTAVVFNALPWAPVSGTTYEIQFNWNTSTGSMRCFVDGVVIGSLTVTSFTRGSSATQMRVGAGAVYPVANAYFDDLVLFSTVQNTTTYTPGYSLPETIYPATTVIPPELEHVGAGGFLLVTAFEVTESNAPRYSIDPDCPSSFYYWNGSAWVLSNGSYAQTNDSATIAANVGSLGLLESPCFQLKIHFTDSDVQQSVDMASVQVYESTGYPTTEQAVTPIGRFSAGLLESFTKAASIPAGTHLKFICEVDSVKKYWSGVAWRSSNGTLAQANTSAEVEANIAALIDRESLIKVIPILKTDNALYTPEINSMAVQYLEDPRGMRGFLDSILEFVGAASLTDAEFESESIQALTEPEYTIDVYLALLGVLDAREMVSNERVRLGDYFNAAGVDVGTPSDGKSNILVGAAL